MIVLAFVMTIFAALFSAFVVFANGMSDAPQMEFQGLGYMIGAWILAAVFWIGWWVG